LIPRAFQLIICYDLTINAYLCKNSQWNGGGLENCLHGIETTWGRWPCSQEECWRDKETVVKLMYLLYYPKGNGET